MCFLFFFLKINTESWVELVLFIWQSILLPIETQTNRVWCSCCIKIIYKQWIIEVLDIKEDISLRKECRRQNGKKKNIGNSPETFAVERKTKKKKKKLKIHHKNLIKMSGPSYLYEKFTSVLAVVELSCSSTTTRHYKSVLSAPSIIHLMPFDL